MPGATVDRVQLLAHRRPTETTTVPHLPPDHLSRNFLAGLPATGEPLPEVPDRLPDALTAPPARTRPTIPALLTPPRWGGVRRSWAFDGETTPRWPWLGSCSCRR